jgi:transposase-like protein
MYLYRPVDAVGNTLDFLLNDTRSTRAANRFFRKMLGNPHVTQPRVINVERIGSCACLSKFFATQPDYLSPPSLVAYSPSF